MANRPLNVAVVGATGAVGVEMLKTLEKRNFPVKDLRLLASARSAGKTTQFNGKTYTIQELTPNSFEGIDVALFSAGASISREFAPYAVKAGAVVVDNSSCFRMDPEVPLVVPEVNPEDIADGGVTYAEGLKTLGVSRVSMGVQSLDDGILRWMNRRHDAATAARAFGILRDGGIDNISVDVIFGLSQLSEKCLEDTLNGILSWHPDHISAYQLSIEEGGALAEMTARGRYREADEELCGRQYSLICGTLAQAGMHHYEISNWALPGREAVHNGAYWTRAPYVGLGPGAHSLTAMRDGTQMRSWNSESPEGWMSEGETLTAEDILTEEIMLGLRTDRGVKAGIIDADIAGEMLRNGCLERAGDNLRIPEDKFFVSDDIIGSIVAAY